MKFHLGDFVKINQSGFYQNCFGHVIDVTTHYYDSMFTHRSYMVRLEFDARIMTFKEDEIDHA